MNTKHTNRDADSKPWVLIGDDWLVKEAVEALRADAVKAPFVILGDETFLSRPNEGHLQPDLAAVLWPNVWGDGTRGLPPQAWLNANNASLRQGDVDRCLWKTRRLAFKDGGVLSYSRLILVRAATPAVWQEKEASFLGTVSWFQGTRALHQLNALLPQAETFVIEGEATPSFQLALFLAERWHKEVYWILSGSEPLGQWVPAYAQRCLHQRLTRVKGLRLLYHQRIDRLLGDQRLKAVRTTSGKIIAADAVVSFNHRPVGETWTVSLRRQLTQEEGTAEKNGVIILDEHIDPQIPFDWMAKRVRGRLRGGLRRERGSVGQGEDTAAPEGLWHDRIVWGDRTWHFTGIGEYWRRGDGVALRRDSGRSVSNAVWRRDGVWCAWAGTDATVLRCFEMHACRRSRGEDMIHWMKAWGHRMEDHPAVGVATLPGWRLLPAGVS